ncbi:hypothetical protein EV126DRAFT_428510 [Verticillium dahliae]|nr:hypothetical protein EV126DRAFT_428510 [Verticillium dahliae]
MFSRHDGLELSPWICLIHWISWTVTRAAEPLTIRWNNSCQKTAGHGPSTGQRTVAHHVQPCLSLLSNMAHLDGASAAAA